MPQLFRHNLGTTTNMRPHEIDAWIAIDPDDSILIRYQRSEMGQGSMTALPMMITEELQCDWSKVRIEYASSNRSVRENRVYGNMYSHGSMSVRESQKMVQQVGASARERIIAAAAARWHVPASECAATQSVVTHRPSGRTLRYGELAADAAKVKLAKEPAIKTPAQFTFLPRRMPPSRLSAQDRRIRQVRNRRTGSRYGFSPPSTLVPCAGASLRVLTSPCFPACRASFVWSKLDDAVAVVATDSFWRAKRALSRLQPEWNVGAAGHVDSEQLSKEFRAALTDRMVIARNDGKHR